MLLFFLHRCWRIWKEHHSKANEVRLHCLLLFMTTTTVKCTRRWIYMYFPQINKLHYTTIIHVTLFTEKSAFNGCRPVLSEGMAQFVSKPLFPYFLSVTLPLTVSSFSWDPFMSQLFCCRARFHFAFFHLFLPETNPVRPCYSCTAPVSYKTNLSWDCQCSCWLISSWKSSGVPSVPSQHVTSLSLQKRDGLGSKSNTLALTAEHLVIHMFASKKFKLWQEGPSVWTLCGHVCWKICSVTS